MSIQAIPTVLLPAGESIPVMGLGTWMYGSGAAEVLVGEAIAGRRDEVFLVNKVLPHMRRTWTRSRRVARA
jgi:diketogulonate reductase-like aldo/keto reductase